MFKILLSDLGIQLLIRSREWDGQVAAPPELTGMPLRLAANKADEHSEMGNCENRETWHPLGWIYWVTKYLRKALRGQRMLKGDHWVWAWVTSGGGAPGWSTAVILAHSRAVKGNGDREHDPLVSVILGKIY